MTISKTKAKVFLAELSAQSPGDVLDSAVEKLSQAIRLDQVIAATDLVAIKMHFGEKGNTTHVQPMQIKPIVQRIKSLGAAPFLADTSVLYKSARSDAVSHLHLAHEHGFTIDAVGAPVIILDGLLGDSELEVAIEGKIFKTVSIAREILKANAIVVVSHVTGHMGMGLGGAIKNLGMGLSSRKGKMRQHSATKPEIMSAKCTACGLCIEWCPEGAITLDDGTALIDSAKCIGCGECLTVCRFEAVKYDWAVGSADLQSKTAEHALGVVTGRTNKIAYFNFVVNVTKDCDCIKHAGKAICADVGLLASRDPVAIDKASVDLIGERNKSPFRRLAYNHIDETIQMRHGQKIGLGSMSYDLERV